MATVYLAHDLKHERQVAVKVLRPELAAALGPERFHQEIKIAANLTHPHILPLHDSGDVDGFLYYAMPYIEGESLRDKLAHEGELPIAEAVRILRDVVDALSEAHAKGVVHRDIKPDKVLLTKNHALVTDFGVAEAVSEATGAHKLTTFDGVCLVVGRASSYRVYYGGGATKATDVDCLLVRHSLQRGTSVRKIAVRATCGVYATGRLAGY